MYTEGSEEESRAADVQVQEATLPGETPKAAVKRPPSRPTPGRGPETKA